MANDGGDKKHPATHSKLRRLKEAGQWYASRELTASAMMGALALLWSSAMPWFSDRALFLVLSAWQPDRIASADPLHAFDETVRQSAATAALMVAVVVVAMFLVGALVRFLQVGPLFSTKPLWNIQTLNPFSGFKRIFFSSQTYLQAALGLLKAALMMGLVTASVWGAAPNLIRSVRLGPLGTVSVFQSMFTTFLWQASALYALFGGADYFVQRITFQRRNRMTDEELKEDTKNEQGNPESKMRMRELGFTISMAPPSEDRGKQRPVDILQNIPGGQKK
jgi:flagellar biosynthesis protein FlhB